MSEASLLTILFLGFVSGVLVGLWVYPKILRFALWLERRFYEKESEEKRKGD